MSVETIFQIQLALGYVAWGLVVVRYGWPRLRAMERGALHRAIATLHGFRFFGLVFLVPGVVGADLPPGFATYAAYGDFATGVLALAALLASRIPALFWPLVVAFNLVGTVDLLGDYWHATTLGLPALAGSLGATYVIPILYVPVLMITHGIAFYSLLRAQPVGARALGGAAAS